MDEREEGAGNMKLVRNRKLLGKVIKLHDRKESKQYFESLIA